jgi:CheY-like chemotaxis protein
MENKHVVLIVDDTPENLRVLGDMLEQEGYEVLVATNGPEALENARAVPSPDLILLDIMMPDMDGFEVCRHLKADPDLKRIPVIFISALGMTDQKVQAFREGAVDYVTKPFQAEEVVARVNTQIQVARTDELKQEIAERKRVEALLIEQAETQRQLREQVMQQQKLDSIGLLAGGIAHDFNNMLTPIFGYAHLIQKKFEPDNKIYGYAGLILDAADKSKNLIQQLMSFSRKQTLTVKKYDLNEIVTSFMTMLGSTVRENIAVRLELCPDACFFQGDRIQTEQILLNLAVNAQDAIAGNGAITIETGHVVVDDEYSRHHPGAQAGSYVMLVFADSGCGMDEEVLSHIFEPFYTSKEVGRGTGLGLSTVFGIVKQHGGYIEVQSSPGAGTTFRIYLPEDKVDAAQEARKTPEKIKPSRATATILLVEDNRMLLDYAQLLLEDQGYTVLAAEAPETALALALGNRVIDLLVSDVVMPHMNGPELYQLILETRPELGVLFMSGYPGSVATPLGVPGAPVSFIAKPFTSEEFIKRVATALEP